MGRERGSDIVKRWPAESREAAEIVIRKYGEPHEATGSLLIWHKAGPWTRVVASRSFYQHDFPTPHSGAVESFIDYRVVAPVAGRAYAPGKAAR
jgi:hypothetical protein